MMDLEDKIPQLRRIIADNVKPLLQTKAIIADAPHYENIGDSLIWRGTTDFLRENSVKLLRSYGAGYFPFPDPGKDVTIILTGGGNFGDLWRDLQEVRLEIIDRFPENRIVMLPQSVHYQDKSLLEKDSELMGRHSDLHLFARDRASYSIMSAHFSRNHIHLAPDMAFWIDPGMLSRHRGREEGKSLFLLRGDKELPEDAPSARHEADVTTDWPRPERFEHTIRNLMRARRISAWLRRHGDGSALADRAIEIYANRFVRDSLTRKGCEFLEPFSRIITTRLHTMILSVLLHKPVEFIDNNYGKLSSFAETWLCDLSEVKPYGRN